MLVRVRRVSILPLIAVFAMNPAVMQNATDDKNYEIHFAPSAVSHRDELGVGREVLVRATFEGMRYMAQSVNPARPKDEEEK